MRSRPFLSRRAETGVASSRMMRVPHLNDVLKARTNIRPYLSPTPLAHYPGLSRLVGAEICVKHENHLPTGAFKVRGGVNLVSQLSPQERATGVIGASTGNHGQAIAFAAKIFDVPAVVCVPRDANPAKVESIRDLGAEVVFHGKDFDEAREHCEQLAIEHGYRYIHSGNEFHLLAGVGTATLEMLETRPDIDVIMVPVGGGSGASAACIVAKAVNPSIQVIGVQAEAAPSAYKSWSAKALIEDTSATFAEGLATRTAFELPQRILWDLLDDFILVSDDDLRQAMIVMIDKTRNMVEAAGAAALAGAMKSQDRLHGKTVALVCTGGNVTLPQLRELLQLSPSL